MRVNRSFKITWVGLIVAVMTVTGYCQIVQTRGATAPAADSSPVYDIPKLEKIVIDGRHEDWGPTGGLRIFRLMVSKGEPKSSVDHDARIRLAWDDRGLLLLAFVRDDIWIEAKKEDGLWQYDSIEMFLAPKRGAPNQCRWIISPGMTPEQQSPRWQSLRRSYKWTLEALPAKLTVARSRTEDGYILEALAPWEALPIKPEVGREIGVQIRINDSDKLRQWRPYIATWHPLSPAVPVTAHMHRVRLATRAPVAVQVHTYATYDVDRLSIAVDFATGREEAGKQVTVVESGKTLALSKLAEDDFGRATALMHIPMRPADKPYGPLTVHLDGKANAVDTINLLVDGKCAEAFLWQSPNAQPAVFSGQELPKIGFERPLWMERLIGSYELKTTYYDKDYNVVTRAETPGRYGAIVEIITKDGRVYRRFKTLYRQAEDLAWWKHDLKAEVMLPDELGIRPEAVASQSAAVADFVKRRIVESFSKTDDGAVLMAGLYETKATEQTNDFYTNPQQRDRQWWVGLKRKLYGWDKQYPKPFVCPRPIEGDPAPVVREGTAEEAGVKGDTADRIDDVLKEWADNSDEAFAVCVVRHGVIVLHKAYGTRDAAPMTVTTKSWMASITKMMSGTLMMMLVDQGLIDLDDRADKYLPPFQGVKTNRPLTIRHLYTHTSGMDGHWGDDLNDMEERVASVMPYYEVGERYHYNGTGMALACKILEAVSCESLPSFYHNHLLEPLGCDHTDVSNASYDMRSTPLDVAKIGQMLLNKGTYGKMRFMREETFEKMLPTRLTKVLGPSANTVYGIGTSFYNDKRFGTGTFGHGAASAATIRIDPENDLVIVMTRNDMGSSKSTFKKYHDRFIDAIVQGMME